jgi:glycosyltransferase involved in cell wall biosynthesis
MKQEQFVFLTPAYNCRDTIRQTMFSMFAQSYDNWRAIIVDDVSTDGTGEFARELADMCGFGEKVKIIRREEKYGEVRNTLTELNDILDEEIVVRLDGGDWITDNDCLYMLNDIYKEHDPAVCWTGHRWSYTTYSISNELKLAQNQSIYDHPWVTSHLKTFRSKALKKVNKKNFFDDEGNWIMIACDQAVFLPMMHLALRDIKPLVFLPRICYHYNIDLEKPDLFTEDRSLKQKISAEWIRARGYVD